MFLFGDKAQFGFTETPACMAEYFGELAAPIGQGRKVQQVLPDGLGKRNLLRVLSGQLGKSVMITMFVPEKSMWQHDDQSADLAYQIIEPPGPEHGIVHAFMLQ